MAQETPAEGFVINPHPEPSTDVKFLAESAPLKAAGSVTWTKGEVPYYQQDNTQWCWAASLTMQHQWWSPVQLGTSYQQQSEIVRYIKGNIVNEGATADEILRAIREWNGVNSMYEPFRINYKGEGKLLSTDVPTSYTDDPKSWIAYRQASVIAFVDTDGDGSANHAVLIIGYDDALNGGTVYIHDPWYSNWWPNHAGQSNADLALTYSDFNARWNSVYEGIWPFQKRHGMVIGDPGDNQWIRLNYASIKFSGPIYDNQLEQIYDIGLGVGTDNAAPYYDSFGQYYENGVFVGLHDTNAGETSYPVGDGTFDGHSPNPANSSISFRKGAIAKDSTVTGAYFYIRPKAVGRIILDYQWWEYDEDERVHSSSHITVLDDRGGADTSHQMMKPMRYKYVHGWYSSGFDVSDDDASGPTISNPSSSGDIYDDYSGSYRIQASVTDPSGVSRVQFSYRFDGSWSSWYDSSGNSGSGYWYDIPRGVWTNYVGKTVYFKVHAYDNDNDRPNDSAETYSPEYQGGKILARSVSTVTVTVTVTSTQRSTLYSNRTTTTSVTSYTSTSTSTSTIPTLTTVVLVPLTVTSTVQSTQYQTSVLTTTVTSYTSTQSSTSTIVVPTTVVLIPSTMTSTVQSTQYLTSILTTTVTSYTATTTSTSTSVVYTTITVSPGGAGAGASSPLAYLGFLSLLAITVGRTVTAGKAGRVPKVRSLMKRRCSTS
jgi:hypothetical protein